MMDEDWIDTEELRTPAQLQSLADAAHRIEGTTVGATGVLVLAQSAGGLTRGGFAYLWPALVLSGGVVLGSFILLYRGRSEVPGVWRLVIHDVQQRQHLFVSLVFSLSGLVEVLIRVGTLAQRPWSLVWPLGLVSIGGLFLAYVQHGAASSVPKAMRTHRYLGLTLILAGVLRAFSLYLPSADPLWAVALLVSAGLFLAYREPAGAFRSDGLTTHYMGLPS